MAEQGTTPETSPGPMPTRTLILRAAEALFDQVPYDQVTVRQIAAAAGVDEATVYRHFGSKDGIAAGCWIPHLEELRSQIQTDLSEKTTRPVEIITDHIRRLAAIAHTDSHITFAMLHAVLAATIREGTDIGEDDPRALVQLPDLLVEPIRMAQAAGAIRDDIPAFELAAFISNSLLLRSATRPNAQPEETTEFILAIIMPGLLPPTPANEPTSP